MKLHRIALAMALIAAFTSCEDFLDREPQSSVSPDIYFTEASQLQAYTDDMYPRILSGNSGNSYGYYATDQGTDNQITGTAPDRFYEGQWKVPNSGGDWSFEVIYRLNFFFSNVLLRFGDDLNGSKNTINGDLAGIKHYIGEMYVLRALEYFKRYQKFGDFPVITEPLPDDALVLTNASKRMPRNEVARFILSDLDKAITLLAGKDMATTRINLDLALLVKSRVALFEGTWLKYFRSTAFVPNGEGWPGKTKDYNASYQFPSGSIDNEINYFLEQAMSASKGVAEKHKSKLTANTGVLQQSVTEAANPYYEMFAVENLSSVPEVLLWRQYALGISTHDVCLAANQGNWAVGMTRAYVQNFLMADGTPVYSHGTYADGDGYYQGDKTIADVRANRDSRLALFLKEPGQKNILIDGSSALSILYKVEPYPGITQGADQVAYTTGYALRKGGSFDIRFYSDMQKCYTGLVLYRSVEALLNYMEASYERNGNLDGTARGYWQTIRQRAHVNTDIDATIASTDMNKEAENDWGAYSGGQLVDATLYNIRRERRSEFISEGLRYMDLCRWRAMDQMTTTPYIPEGIHLWNTPMESWYSNLKADGTTSANVSPESDGEYLRPYRKTGTQRCYNGFTWKMAHYLEPIMIKQFLLTSPDGSTVSGSPIYQNPYWPTVSDQPAEQ
ncbi:MAG: RagB/SusD family nutrient uptake outer membrane protein [Breznakibacter sp.]